MAYIYAISDIHGRYDLLKNVVDEWVRFENGDQLILVGDYIDGDCHGNSCLTLQYIYQLQLAYPQQVIVLQGNHEEWLLSFLEDRETYLDTQIDMSFSTLERNDIHLSTSICLSSRSFLYNRRYVSSMP